MRALVSCYLCGEHIATRDSPHPSPHLFTLELWNEGYRDTWAVCKDCYVAVHGPKDNEEASDERT